MRSMRELQLIFWIITACIPVPARHLSPIWGMAYIAFAREERHLFELLFVSDNQDGKHKKKSMYEILNGDAGNVVYESTWPEWRAARIPVICS